MLIHHLRDGAVAVYKMPGERRAGPVGIITTDGVYGIDSCVFYACTPKSPKDTPEANFGMAKITPWSTSSWNRPLRNLVMQSPLSYGSALYAEADFKPATMMLSGTATQAEPRSRLVMHATAPSGYTLLSTIPKPHGCRSCRPRSRSAADDRLAGHCLPLIAMIDTGGGPVMLSDPNGYVWPKTWPNTLPSCPGWPAPRWTATAFMMPADRLPRRQSGGGTYAYIDRHQLPAASGPRPHRRDVQDERVHAGSAGHEYRRHLLLVQSPPDRLCRRSRVGPKSALSSMLLVRGYAHGGHALVLRRCPISGVVSTGRRNTGVKSLCGGFKLQGLTWSFIELTSHFVQIGLRMHR